MTVSSIETARSAACLDAVADAMEAATERLAAQQVDAVRACFDSYASVPEDSVIESARRNVGHVVAALRRRRPPLPDEIDEGRRTRERTVQGVPANEMHDAYRMCLRLLGEAFVEEAERASVGVDALVVGTRLLWQTSDALTSVVVSARQEAELDVARHDEGQRLDFLRTLVFRTGARPDLRKRAAAFGLPTDREYWVVRANALPERREALRATLDASTRSYGCRSLVGVIDGDVVGVLPKRPVLADAEFTVGIGGPTSLDAMPQAFAAASRMLEVALGFDLSGCHELSDLSLRVAVASEPELGEMLVRRYLAPLDEEGDFGTLLARTVQVHLEGGGRILTTARRLGVHQNTVRHRLGRFEYLCDARLDDFTVTLEVWWALLWRSHQDRHRP